MGKGEYATAEGTNRFFEKIKNKINEKSYRNFNGIKLSTIGMGTFLGEMTNSVDKLYEESLENFLKFGGNVIDTAINYRNQMSERCIGRKLKKLFKEKKVSRDEILISTKGGFLFDFKDQNLNKGASLLDIVSSHSINVNFIKKQLERSLKNLKLKTIDIYYIHNPELEIIKIGNRTEFYKKINKLFSLLENKISENKIRFYGTATWNGYRTPSTNQEYLSLEIMTKIAKDVGGRNNHFKAIQLPYNPNMLEAFLFKNQVFEKEYYSVLELAKRFNIYVFSSASLSQGRVINSHDYMKGKTILNTPKKIIQFVRSTPGIGTSLVGMKNPKHVKENLKVLRTPTLSQKDFLDYIKYYKIKYKYSAPRPKEGN